MYIKIVSDNRNKARMFECDEVYYDRITEDEKIFIRNNIIYAFPENASVDPANYHTELWLFGPNDEVRQVLLLGCTVYLMSSSGKTIDTIYA